MLVKNIYKRVKLFRESRPATGSIPEMVYSVKVLILAEWIFSLEDISDQLGISVSTAQMMI